MPQPSLTHYEVLTPEMLEKMVARNAKREGSSVIKVTDEGILNCKSVARDEQAWIYWNTFLPQGATIEVTFEARNINAGSEGRMTLDIFPDATKVGGGQVDFIEMDTNGFKAYSFGYTSMMDSYASLTFGLWDALIGECEFRNIAIKIYGGTPVPDIRQAMLVCAASDKVWKIDDGFGRFSNIGVTKVEFEADKERLKVTYAKMNSWSRPLITAAMSFDNGYRGYVVQPYAQNNDYAYLYISDRNGNPVTKPATGAESFFVTFIAQSN